jgi:hypothetical protein
VLVIRNGIPPGDLVSRAAYVAANLTAWRISWAIWMPASLALVLFFAGWADTLPYKAWGVIAVALTLAGARIDWVDEIFWIGLAPELAARFASDVFAAGAYAMWDRAYIVIWMGLANALYTLGGIILMALTLKSRGFPKWLAWFSTLVWAVSIDLSIVAWIGDGVWIQAVSAIVFVLFMPWLLLMGLEISQPSRGEAFARRTD